MKALLTALALLLATSAAADEPLKLTAEQMDRITAGAQPEVTAVVVDSAHQRNTANKELQQDLKDAKQAGIEIDPEFVAERREIARGIFINPGHETGEPGIGGDIQATR